MSEPETIPLTEDPPRRPGAGVEYHWLGHSGLIFCGLDVPDHLRGLGGRHLRYLHGSLADWSRKPIEIADTIGAWATRLRGHVCPTCYPGYIRRAVIAPSPEAIAAARQQLAEAEERQELQRWRARNTGPHDFSDRYLAVRLPATGQVVRACAGCGAFEPAELVPVCPRNFTRDEVKRNIEQYVAGGGL